MYMTKHADIRAQQRGFQHTIINLILMHGTPVKKRGDVLEFSIRKKNMPHLTSDDGLNIQQLEKAQGKAVLMNAQTGLVLTLYNKK